LNGNQNKFSQKYLQKNKPLVLSGAMGSFLQQSGNADDKFLWQSRINYEHPNKVKELHIKYLEAGAEIITTNTFRTNPEAVKISNLDISIKDFVNKSVRIAFEANENFNAVIAGSNPPAEDCYQFERTISKSDLEYNHKKHIDLLWESGVDIIWNETQSHKDEIELIGSFCSINKLPFVISIFFTEDLKLLSGENIEEAVKIISQFDPIAIGFNCIKLTTFQSYYNKNQSKYSHGFYLNCGSGSIKDKSITCGISPEVYINSITKFINSNTLFVGSCCGSSPDHTRVIKDYIDGFNC